MKTKIDEDIEIVVEDEDIEIVVEDEDIEIVVEDEDIEIVEDTEVMNFGSQQLANISTNVAQKKENTEHPSADDAINHAINEIDRLDSNGYVAALTKDGTLIHPNSAGGHNVVRKGSLVETTPHLIRATIANPASTNEEIIKSVDDLNDAPITQTDIAKLTDTHQSSVSKVLNPPKKD